ncbi:hypothetical protein MXM31_02125 [Klebsiella aerogenes]|uniref:hypothetical protein n=1 Tax=Klebsiella aerogenes TaxID=548 RepID=UPI002DBCB990|nr:hypothetical protein [Klebsiella aerogenes]MEB5694991.1 hypothetical protein [Klebsiella aerogenes]
MKILIALLCIAVSVSALSSERRLTREMLAMGLEKALLCQKNDVDIGADAVLNITGITVQKNDAPYYNQFRYSFKEPLAVNQLALYSVQQSVGEGGAVLLAEAAGEMQNFADRLAAHPLAENEDVLGVSGVMFLKIEAGAGAGNESAVSKIVIGQNAVQKAQGRFFYGCIQAMTL